MIVRFTTTYEISTYHLESHTSGVYSIQHFVITFVSDLRQNGGFIQVFRFSPPKKTDHHDITEILLKVASNTITPTLEPISALHILYNIYSYCFQEIQFTRSTTMMMIIILPILQQFHRLEMLQYNQDQY